MVIRAVNGRMEIRQAEKRDVPALMDIARTAFPSSLRWQVLPFSEQYWAQAVIDGERSGAETWVATINGKVVGAIVLITEERRWSRRRRPVHLPVSQHLRSVGYIPVAAKVLGLKLSDAAAKRTGADEPRVETLKCPPRERLSVDLTIVDTHVRGRGVGRALRGHAENRCESLGRRYIRTLTSNDNVAMRHLLGSMGYSLVGTKGNMGVYLKDVTQE